MLYEDRSLTPYLLGLLLNSSYTRRSTLRLLILENRPDVPGRY